MTIERVTYDEGKCDFDELVAGDARVHIERMSNQHVWMAIESGPRRIVLNFHSARGLSVNLYDEKVECQHDKTKPNPSLVPLGSNAIGSSDWTWMCKACNERFVLPMYSAQETPPELCPGGCGQRLEDIKAGHACIPTMNR